MLPSIKFSFYDKYMSSHSTSVTGSILLSVICCKSIGFTYQAFLVRSVARHQAVKGRRKLLVGSMAMYHNGVD